MFCEIMVVDYGMLFIFDGEGEWYFWMKNILLLFDIIYISSVGVIVSIVVDMMFYLEKVILFNGVVKYVLELNVGIVWKLGILVGDRVVSFFMVVE